MIKRAALGCTACLFVLAGSVASANDETATQERPYALELGVKIPMPDGTRLGATLYRPTRQTQPLPVVMIVTPYMADRFEPAGRYFAQHGYVLAAVDSRGRGNSEGEFVPWIHEGDDGAAAVQWLARQSWCDGRVVTWGGSYSGKNQWAIASRAPTALHAIAPSAAGYVGYDMGMVRNIPLPWMQRYLTYISGKTLNANLYADDAYWLAAFAELSRGAIPYRDFDVLSGNSSPIWRKWIAHPEPDAYWAQGNASREQLARIRIPVLSITGTYDDAQLGTLKFWREHRDSTERRESDRDFLVIGPWDHGGTRQPRQNLGGLDFSVNSVVDVAALHVEWYDWVLKGKSQPEFLRNHFMYYVAGRDEWRAAPDLEAAAGAQRTYYLSSPSSSAASIAERGRLGASPGRKETDKFTYDPSLPAHNEGFEGGSAVGSDYLVTPAIMNRLKGDGLVYDTPPFAEPTDFVGFPSATLGIRLDVPDTDFRVQFYEVRADGRVIYLSQDFMRARYRLGDQRPELVPVGRLQRYKFDRFYWVARTISAGSVIRMLIVPLGASIHDQRNRNSGGVVADETSRDNRVAHVQVELGPGLSTVELPVGSRNANSDTK